MNFNSLAKYINSFDKEYDIPGCDCCIYYNHINVFRYRVGMFDKEKCIKTGKRDIYFLNSAAKIMNCVAIMQLVEQYKLQLNDKVSSYIDGFDDNITIKDMIKKYSQTIKDETHNFSYTNITKIIEKVSGMNFYEYIETYITKPLKMKSTSYKLTDKILERLAKQHKISLKSSNTIEQKAKFEELFNKNNGCLATTIDDFSLLCEAICNCGESKNGYRLLTDHSVRYLISDLIYCETEKEDAFVYVEFNGSLIIIDLKKKITLVYAQHIKNQTIKQLEMYPQLRKMAYECIGVDTWSKGYNIFPL